MIQTALLILGGWLLLGLLLGLAYSVAGWLARRADST